MRKFLSVFVPLGFVILMVACEDKKESNLVLKEEVLAIHDEVMPKMSNLKESKKLVLAEASRLEEIDADSLMIVEYQNVALQLDDAYESMFVWMRQYKPEPEERTDDELEAYLQEQKKKVTDVNIKIKRALNEAEKLLSN